MTKMKLVADVLLVSAGAYFLAKFVHAMVHLSVVLDRLVQ